MTWRINVHRDAAKQLEAIPPDRRKRIMNDTALADVPFRGFVKALNGKKFKGLYEMVSGRYRIIFEPMFATRSVEGLAARLRNEGTYHRMPRLRAPTRWLLITLLSLLVGLKSLIPHDHPRTFQE